MPKIYKFFIKIYSSLSKSVNFFSKLTNSRPMNAFFLLLFMRVLCIKKLDVLKWRKIIVSYVCVFSIEEIRHFYYKMLFVFVIMYVCIFGQGVNLGIFVSLYGKKNIEIEKKILITSWLKIILCLRFYIYIVAKKNNNNQITQCTLIEHSTFF